MATQIKKSKEQQALNYAKRLYRSTDDWVEFHNDLFGNGGKLGELFKTKSKRKKFSQTEEYRQIVDMLRELMS